MSFPFFRLVGCRSLVWRTNVRGYHVQQTLGTSKVSFVLDNKAESKKEGASSQGAKYTLHISQTSASDEKSSMLIQKIMQHKVLSKFPIVTRIASRVESQFRKTFLPHGYPHSVGDGYVPYVSWIAAGCLFSSAAGVLATQALLASVGVGDQSAKVASAGINWVLKDGLGSLGNILIASHLGNRFDLYPKRWSFRSNMMLQVGIGLEILTLLVPHLFLPLGATANFMKGLAWAAGGASRAAIHFSFSKNMNMGDITAKATAQLIAANMIGLWSGLFLSSVIGNTFMNSFQAYLVLGGLHLFSISRALHHVRLCSLNPERMGYAVESFIQNEPLPSPEAMRNKESFLKIGLAPLASVASHIHLKIGTKIDRITDTPDQLVDLLCLFNDEKYILGFRHNTIHIVFHEKAQTNDLLTACLHAGKMRQYMSSAKLPESQDDLWRFTYEAISTTKRFSADHVGPFSKDLTSAGWNTSAVFLEIRSQRAVWGSSSEQA
eukprot:TRINITY_DN20059_c0_g1_i1.p1 TRINITY_DN20059_c0_g1~~TRINITY_DN20059_c0_g1_i1.p1  ORF type:complete len:492 (-),score=86.71 TRINITY_DN20059_c0_g1_i1:289-1764(-)